MRYELKHYEVNCDRDGCKFRRIVVCQSREIPEQQAGLTRWDLPDHGTLPRFYWLCSACIVEGCEDGLEAAPP